MPTSLETKPEPAKPRILIVEDEGLIARDIESRVQKAGYEVVGIVDSGEQALERIPEIGPDLILMDIRLGGAMDGIETAAKVQKTHDLPIIYLTAHSDRETLNRAKATGPFGFLTKPLSPTSLPTSIEVALYKHRMERELRQQRAWLRTAIQTMADAVIITDQLGRISHLNPAAERLTQWSKEEALQYPLSHILKLQHPEFGQRFDDLSPAGLLNGKARPLPAGLKLVTRNQERLSVEGEIAPSAEDGTALGAVITFRDTTLREQEEQERRHEQKMEAVGRLASGVAHDFNNLLTVILGYTGLLLNRDNIDQPTREALAEIEHAGTTAATLARQLLTFSRNQVMEPRLVDLNALIRRNEEVFQRLLGSGVEWHTDLAPQLNSVYGDPRHLAQVIINLVVNARDAMPAGGALTLSTENAAVSESADLVSDSENHVVLSVKDTGIGMDPGVADHIFEPFFTTKSGTHGTGLGLAIVYNLINNLGGVIAVASQPGGGTTFRVFLPIAEPGLRPAPVPDYQSRSGVVRQRTLLLVDDNEAVLTIMQKYLEGYGYNILQASDAQQALALAGDYDDEIDVLVTDVVMPKMNGVRLAEQIMRLRPKVKTIFVSGYASDVVDQQSPILEGARFLQKPFLHSDLLRQVEELLDASPQLRQQRQTVDKIQ